MRITAILAIRNERLYLANCLSHLIQQGIDYFILDNDSDDGTRELLQEVRFSGNLVGYQRFHFDGWFNWEGLLRAREEVAERIDSDWIITGAPDEIWHPFTGETLHQAIERLASDGYDVINFEEFVFLPIDHDYSVDTTSPQPMLHYYYFAPRRLRQMRARKRTLKVSHMHTGGHVLEGEHFRLAPEQFALRHYIFRSQEHALAKFAERKFRPAELRRGWHKNRAYQAREDFIFPKPAELDLLDDSGGDLTRGRPREAHYWQWPKSKRPRRSAVG